MFSIHRYGVVSLSWKLKMYKINLMWMYRKELLIILLRDFYICCFMWLPLMLLLESFMKWIHFTKYTWHLVKYLEERKLWIILHLENAFSFEKPLIFPKYLKWYQHFFFIVHHWKWNFITVSVFLAIKINTRNYFFILHYNWLNFFKKILKKVNNFASYEYFVRSLSSTSSLCHLNNLNHLLSDMYSSAHLYLYLHNTWNPHSISL